MAAGVNHPFTNFVFDAPPGREDEVGSLGVFITTNPERTAITSVTTAWELDDEEIAEIVRTRKIMYNQMGGGLHAHYITSPEKMRDFVTMYGATWPRESGDAG